MEFVVVQYVDCGADSDGTDDAILPRGAISLYLCAWEH